VSGAARPPVRRPPGAGTRDLSAAVASAASPDAADGVGPEPVDAQIDPTGPPIDPIELISMVSHELRGPITAVKSYSGMLQDRWDRLDDDAKLMMLRQVGHEADRVFRMVTELLDVSRLQLGRIQLRPEPVDLARMVGSTVEAVAMEWPTLVATVSFDDDVPAVEADRDKVRQVLTNLVENACKYGEAGRLDIRGVVDGGAVRLSVRDHGPGIAEADLSHVFERFFRGDQAQPTGIGLGLWISRGLVEAHGGVMEVESQVGVGTTLSFTLPIAPADRS
jgi:signal transduction histidine kinase